MLYAKNSRVAAHKVVFMYELTIESSVRKSMKDHVSYRYHTKCKASCTRASQQCVG